MNDTAAIDPAADAPIATRGERALRDRAERGREQLRELEADLGGMHGDNGTIQEDRNGMRQLVETVRADLNRIDRALARIDAGTYGRCTSCGRPIAEPRLSAIPEAEHCATCA